MYPQTASADVQPSKPTAITRALPEWVKARARNKLNQLVTLASERLRRKVALPSLGFTLRGTTAGTADLVENHIELNPVLLAENLGTVLGETLAHELAHLITARFYGRGTAPHGREWQHVMRHILDTEPSRCHTFDISRARTGTVAYIYRCGCEGRDHELTARRHSVASTPGKTYSCKRCRKPIVFAHTLDLAKMRAKAPTLAQIAYANLVAERACVTLPAETREDKHLCRRFIELHDTTEPENVPTTAGHVPVVSPCTTTSRRSLTAAPSSPRIPPTPKQLTLARRLETQCGERLPKSTLSDRAEMATWIGEQLNKLKRAA